MRAIRSSITRRSASIWGSPRPPLFTAPRAGFDLVSARPAEEAEAAALALKVRPRPHQPALLIGQMRQFDLQRPFPRARPPAEDFKDQPRSIDHLCAPGLLKIALLHGRDRAIHDDDRSRQAFHHSGNLIDLAFAD